MVTAQVNGLGTDERLWRSWLGGIEIPELPAIPDGRRVVIVAAHPDDEALGVGGLLTRLARRHPVSVIWVTDGEASHPGSTAVPPELLGATRREESRRALVRLGVAPRVGRWLGLPDGRLNDYRPELTAALSRLITDDDVVLSNWCSDGHPDHEVVGEVVQEIASNCWQFPIWMWHWALPGDPRVPWAAARQVQGIDVNRKADAISQYVSQVEAIGAEPADAAILPPRIVAHFLRHAEVLFAV